MMEVEFLEAGFLFGIVAFTYIYFCIDSLFLQVKEKRFKKFLDEKSLQKEFYVWKQTQSRFWRKLE